MIASLEGLSVGDAFGETFFGPTHEVMARIRSRELHDGNWRWTDDTQMAISVVEQLLETGTIDQDELALRFARRMEPNRGYGYGTLTLLEGVRLGMTWRSLAASGFGGEGSFGNGAAMRAAPLGAYFASDLTVVVEEARKSAEVTHAHPDGIAGAIAVAVAAALVCREARGGPDFLREVAALTPSSTVKAGIEEAARLDPECIVLAAAEQLGNGSRITAADTVPFCLWVVSHHRLFDEALWETVSALGDRDTTCAIVGGVVGARVGIEGIPSEWRRRREPLPDLR